MTHPAFNALLPWCLFFIHCQYNVINFCCCGGYCHSLKWDRNKNVVCTQTLPTGFTGVGAGERQQHWLVWRRAVWFLRLCDTVRRTFSKWCGVWYLSRCHCYLLVFMTGLIWQPCVLAFCRSESWVGKGQTKGQKYSSNGEKSVNLSGKIFVELYFRDETTNFGLIKLHPLHLFCLSAIFTVKADVWKD